MELLNAITRLLSEETKPKCHASSDTSDFATGSDHDVELDYGGVDGFEHNSSDYYYPNDIPEEEFGGYGAVETGFKHSDQYASEPPDQRAHEDVHETGGEGRTLFWGEQDILSIFSFPKEGNDGHSDEDCPEEEGGEIGVEEVHVLHFDYTMLSVAVWTLALVLAVEMLRQFLDRKAQNRPFLRTVLEGMYRELTTLGIVEFAVFFVQKYTHQHINEEVERAFANVHFLLFFAAIINSFMTVFLAIFSSLISDRMWVRTEELELNHYVAIRDEFERVDAALKRMEGGGRSSLSSHRDNQRRGSVRSTVSVYSVEDDGRSGLGRFCHNLCQHVRYPLLKRKHDRLLVQVRFHELRVHFLKSNNLPLKFRVSEYLKKSEMHVLKKLVHISSFAWVVVASFVNLLYFLMGITAHVTAREEIVGIALGSVYTGLIIVFIPMAIIIERKMERVFQQIMRMEMVDSAKNERNGEEDDKFVDVGCYNKGGLATNKHSQSSDAEEHVDTDGRRTRQLDLFWGGDPNHIIGAFQFMQLGYAIVTAVLMIFWGSIKWKVLDAFFAVLLLVSYTLFVFTMAQVVPRYTLCTSMGQLVNQRRLHETIANFKLAEAKRKQRHKLEMEEVEAQNHDLLLNLQVGKSEEPAISVDTFEAESGMAKERHDGAAVMEPPGQASKVDKRHDWAIKKRSDDSVKMSQLATLVQTKTKELPRSNDSAPAVQAFPKHAAAKPLATDDGEEISLPKEKRRLKKSQSVVASVQLFHPGAKIPPANDTAQHQSIARTSLNVLPSDKCSIPSPAESSSYCASPGTAVDSKSGHQGFDDDPAEMAPQELDGKRTTSSTSFWGWASQIISFFYSPKYRFISGAFGTNAVFFIVGMRAEIMLIKGPNHIITDNENTWELSAKASFYWEFVLLALFITISSFAFGLALPSSCASGRKDGKHSKSSILFVAASSDIIISAVCLFLLLRAERSRPSCCQASDGTEFCYEFGSRLCDGLGNIEPFTSLIVLRVFRFYFAKLVVKSICSKKKGNVLERQSQDELTGAASDIIPSSNVSRVLQDPLAVANPRRVYAQEGHHVPKSLESATGTIVELWQTAISTYYDVAVKYGEFSGELLQSMLGIPTAGALQGMNHSPAEESPQGTADIRNKGYAGETNREDREQQPLRAPTIRSTNLRPLPLSPQVQAMQFKSSKGVNKEEFDEALSMFANPNARLIRSMRRCERRLLPLLDRWSVVDVVLTREELVYFDARDVDDDGVGGSSLKGLSPEIAKKRNAVKGALVVSQGGKGLRLCDVAAGRKVVGRLELKHVEVAKVECLTPKDEAGWFTDSDDTDEGEPFSSHIKQEFWKASSKNDCISAVQSRSRHLRWKHVLEQRLKLQSLQGSLFLRFYSDLEDSENKMRRDGSVGLTDQFDNKSDALLWCQTIARLCGLNRQPQSGQKSHPSLHPGQDVSGTDLGNFIHIINRGSEYRKQQAIQMVVNKMQSHRHFGSKLGTVSEDIGDHHHRGGRRSDSFRDNNASDVGRGQSGWSSVTHSNSRACASDGTCKDESIPSGDMV